MLVRNILLSIGVLAILIGAVVAGVLMFGGHASRQAGHAVASKGVSVLAASRAIAPGQRLAESDLTWRDLPVKTAPSGSLARGKVTTAQFVGAVSRRGYAAGEIILDSGLTGSNDRQFLAAVLTPGLRAVTLVVDIAQSAAGLVLPNDRVDVVLVRDGATGAGTDSTRASVAQILLQDVRVVATDRTFDRSQPVPNGGAALPRTITVEVGERDAQRLFLAEQIGRVHFALRPFVAQAGDVDEIHAPVWGADLSPGRSSAAPADVLAGAVVHLGSPRAPTERSGRADAPIVILRGGGATAP